MSYDECPRCGDDSAVKKDEDVCVCRSCQIPLKPSWLTDDWTVYDSWSEAP